MQTLEFDLSDASWTEVLGSNNAFALQILTQNNVCLHFSDSDVPPDINAPFVLVQSFTPRWDFECQQQAGQSRVFARAENYPAKIVVVRRVI